MLGLKANLSGPAGTKTTRYATRSWGLAPRKRPSARADARPALAAPVRPALVFVGLALSVAGGCTKRNTPPRLFVEAATIDLGVVDPGIRDFSFNVENRGGSALKVEKIHSSCTCTVAERPKSLRPGEAALVRGVVRVSAGPGSTNLSIFSNDPDGDRAIHLEWFGTCLPTLVPSSITISEPSTGVAVHELEITYPGGEPRQSLSFLGAANLPDGVRLEVVSENPSAIRAIPGLGVSPRQAPYATVGRTLLKLTASAQLNAPASAECLVRVIHRGVTHNLPLAITIRPHRGLSATPDRLLFSATDFSTLMRIRRRTRVHLGASAGRRIEVVQKPDFLAVELETQGSAPLDVALTVSVKSAPPIGSSTERIVLKSAGGPGLVLPVLVSYAPDVTRPQ